ncbi:MAG TPA: NUDIX domain-containing protein [Anaerolineae bacterium]|nr:NUDIX domain-containing protein [Anaerolineae bacterium]
MATRKTQTGKKQARKTTTKAPAESRPRLVIEKSAGAVVFHRRATLEYLLLRAGAWGFPKGLVEVSEAEQDAALREVREETGLAVSLVPNFREVVQYFYRHKDGALVKKQVVYFLCEAERREVRISWEHEEARWVIYEEGLELLQFENLREILRKAHAKLIK